MASVQKIAGSYTGTPLAAGHFLVPLTGSPVFDNTNNEANTGYPTRTLGAYSLLSVRVPVNTAVAATTWTLRVNSADGNEVVSVTALTTGEFIDSVNTDSPTAGQIIAVVSTAASTAEISVLSVVFT